MQCLLCQGFADAALLNIASSIYDVDESNLRGTTMQVEAVIKNTTH